MSQMAIEQRISAASSDAAPSIEALRMDRRLWLVRRHVDHFLSGTTDDGARFVPASEYLDPGIAQAERAFLRTVPLVIAHSSQLPEPHSYRCEELLDVPVIVVRDADGMARAYLNSCSHRGARLLEGEGKTDGRIRCSYHAWSYSHKGELLSLTQEKKFGVVKCSGLSLVELPCAERYGLVFVMLDNTRAMDIDAFLGDFAPHLEMANLDSFAIHECRQLPHAANWKLALCGYLESYHVRVVHGASIGGAFVGNLSTHDAFGPDKQHLLTTWPMMDVAEMSKNSDLETAIRQHPYSPHNTVLYLWPNTIITAPDFIGISHLIRVTPGQKPGEQLTEFRILLPKQIKPEERKSIEDFDDLTIHALENEDYGQLCGIQKALNSGLRKGTFIGENEPSLTEMHRSIARAAGRGTPDMPA
jgi:phenylpropionate dioxygenase-like ring-hydroxylating dioxygenase large terminal subunit